MRDFLNKNTDPPTVNYPWGKSRDGLSDGTWISEEVWSDFIHSIHKMVSFAEEFPDGTIDKNTPTNSGDLHNQQLIDGFAKFFFKVFGDSWKTRLDDSVNTDLKARDYNTIINNYPTKLSVAIPDFFNRTVGFLRNGHAAGYDYLYFINISDPTIAIFSRYDSNLNLIDSFQSMPGELDTSVLFLDDYMDERERGIYHDTSTGQIFDFSFADNTYQNNYIETSPYFANKVILEGGLIFCYDYSANQCIVFSAWSRRETYRYDLRLRGDTPIGIAAYKDRLYILKRNSTRLLIEEYRKNRDSIQWLNDYPTTIPIVFGTVVSARVICGEIHVSAIDFYYILTLKGDLLFKVTSANTQNADQQNISIGSGLIFYGSGANLRWSDVSFTLNSSGE